VNLAGLWPDDVIDPVYPLLRRFESHGLLVIE
jgi:hypothetical protein